jgi:hypothetical protein
MLKDYKSGYGKVCCALPLLVHTRQSIGRLRGGKDKTIAESSRALPRREVEPECARTHGDKREGEKKDERAKN